MTKYLLIRHGETGVLEHTQKPEDSLSDKGRGQSRLLSERIKEENISLIYSSPYKRAIETAEIIAENSGLKIVQDNRLKEIPLWVSPEDLHDDTSKEYVEAVSMLTEAKKKVIKLLHDSHITHKDETIALVCHGNLIRAMLGFALKMDLETVVRLNVSNASLTVVDWEDKTKEPFYRLNSFNETNYLRA